MKRLIVLCFVAVLLVSANAMAQNLTGNDLKKFLGDPDVPTYANGFLVGYVTGIIESASPTVCIPEGVLRGQYAEVVRTYLKDHPEELHLEARALVVKALEKEWPCKK